MDVRVVMALVCACGLAAVLTAAQGRPAVSRGLFDVAWHAEGQVCAPLPAPAGRTVRVSNADALVRAVNTAAPGTTILVADGTYRLDGAVIRMTTPGLTLRGASGRREAVVIDGGYTSAEILQIVASDATVADLSLVRAYDHPIHVMTAGGRDTLRTLLYNLRVIDPGQQAIKVNPSEGGGYTDAGIIACSHLELTDEGRRHVRDRCYTGGVDAHASRDWVVRDNRIEGFWCEQGLAEHAVHFWKVSRDPVVERNVVRNNARGIGFGMADRGSGRRYADATCPGATGYVDHVGGIVRNNAVAADRPDLFASADGFDCGICVWNACGVRVGHNTVFTANPARTFASIEWRFPNTTAEVVNNLVNHTMRGRDGARAASVGNVLDAPAAWFLSPLTGDLRLAPRAPGALDRVTAPSWVTDDLEGQRRPDGAGADVGADERQGPGLAAQGPEGAPARFSGKIPGRLGAARSGARPTRPRTTFRE